MAQAIAITNQKGGVGKTTTVLQFGIGLAQAGKKVLFIDMDSQCSLSYMMGGNVEGVTVLDVLLRQSSAEDAIQHVDESDLIAGNPNLSAIEQYLNQTGKEYRLREVLKPVREKYDIIVIDSPPTLGLLTVNILTAADSVIIPALSDIFSLQGIRQLYETIDAVHTYCNPSLSVDGILLIRHNPRLRHSRELRQRIEEEAAKMQTKVYRTSIREAVTIREAATAKMSIFKYAPKSKQAGDYQDFVNEFLCG